MEQPTALLIADLSGYTALTEVHGAATAADLIDTFMQVVDGSLCGDCVLHQRVGDEVLIVSASADYLLATTRCLMQRLAGENHFLEIHGALHYGKLLMRNGSYFGTAINLTARMARKAANGSVLCAADFLDALSDRSAVCVRPMGRHSFKNLAEELELFELSFGMQDMIFIDPVCKMIIRHPVSAIKHPHRPDIFFCSEECLSAYMKNSLS
jgi:class 3 adenylate cyclase